MREAKRLIICGLEYRVVYATGEEVPELVENEGWCNTKASTIYLRANMPPSRMRDTLVHETAHAFIEASGLSHFLGNHFESEDKYEAFEETLIRLFVPSLLRLVDDNGTALVDVPAKVVGAPTAGRSKAKRGRK